MAADDHDAEREVGLRAAIIRHLQRYPLAGDTPEGMVVSWLPSPGFACAPHVIDAVVATMVAAGELAPRELPDGRVLYVRGPTLSTRP